MAHTGQFRLLAQRRFAPFFGAQALGAFNDNVYKNVLVILAAYQAASYTTMQPQLLANVATGQRSHFRLVQDFTARSSRRI